MDSFREEVRELQIGFKIRRIRQERRMTLQALADATGLSKPLLSQIENEQVIPPLATLLRVAKAFRVPLQSFFQEEGSSSRCVLTRAGESRKMQRRPVDDEHPILYTYHSLAYGKKNRSLEPFLVEFDLGEWRDEMMVSHEGEEFVFLLEGEIDLHYADQIYAMSTGDSVYYDSTEPHAFIARGTVRPRAVAVIFSRD
ncbi:MAG: cupin domain-containing protein [Desulfuromonadales bacterium]|nr:cupin domain-containing protein [Desulfuromonadales bacterium]